MEKAARGCILEGTRLTVTAQIFAIEIVTYGLTMISAMGMLILPLWGVSLVVPALLVF